MEALELLRLSHELLYVCARAHTSRCRRVIAYSLLYDLVPGHTSPSELLRNLAFYAPANAHAVIAKRSVYLYERRACTGERECVSARCNTATADDGCLSGRAFAQAPDSCECERL